MELYKKTEPSFYTNFLLGLDNFKLIFPPDKYNFLHENLRQDVRQSDFYVICKNILGDIEYRGQKINIQSDMIPKYLFLRFIIDKDCNNPSFQSMYHVFSIVINFSNKKLNKIIFLDTNIMENNIDKKTFLKGVCSLFTEQTIIPDELKVNLGFVNPRESKKSEDVLSKYILCPYDFVVKESWINFSKELTLNKVVVGEKLNEMKNILQQNTQMVLNNIVHWYKNDEIKIITEQEKYLKYIEDNEFKKSLQIGENFILKSTSGGTYCNAWSLFFLYEGMFFITISPQCNVDELYNRYKYIYKTLIDNNDMVKFLLIYKFWNDLLNYKQTGKMPTKRSDGEIQSYMPWPLR